MSIKKRKLSSLKSWATKLQALPVGYKLQGIDLHSALKGMTAAELQVVLSIVAAAYSNGCDETRKYWSPKYHSMRQQLERATGSKDITYCGLRLVASNA